MNTIGKMSFVYMSGKKVVFALYSFAGNHNDVLGILGAAVNEHIHRYKCMYIYISLPHIHTNIYTHPYP